MRPLLLFSIGLFICIKTKGAVHYGSSLILPYLWVILVLVFLEGLLAADNAVVMAVMVKHLPPEQRKKRYFMVC